MKKRIFAAVISAGLVVSTLSTESMAAQIKYERIIEDSEVIYEPTNGR